MDFPGPLRLSLRAASAARRFANTLRQANQVNASKPPCEPRPVPVPDPSLALQATLRNNTAKNGSELHLLLAAFRYVREAALRTQNGFSSEVLEIGGYDHPGFPLTLLLLGAERVHLNNITPVRNRLPRAYAETVYALLNGFSVGVTRTLDDVVRPLAGTQDVEVLPHLLNVISATDAAEVELPDNSLGCLYSMAVFEHIRETDAVIANTFRMLRPGGWCFHAVDLRDHRDFSRPLEFLKLSPDEFQAIRPHDTRLRGQDYVNAFEAAGFEIQEARYCTPLPILESGGTDAFDMLLTPSGSLFRPLDQIDVWVTEDQRSDLHPDFQGYSLTQLSATGITLVARKPT